MFQLHGIGCKWDSWFQNAYFAAIFRNKTSKIKLFQFYFVDFYQSASSPAVGACAVAPYFNLNPARPSNGVIAKSKAELTSFNGTMDPLSYASGLSVPLQLTSQAMLSQPFNFGAICTIPPFGALALNHYLPILSQRSRSNSGLRMDSTQHAFSLSNLAPRKDASSAFSSNAKESMHLTSDWYLAGLDKILYFSKLASACNGTQPVLEHD